MVSLTPANSTRNNDNKILGVSDLCRICMLPGDYFKNSSHDITIRICKMLKTSTQIDVGINDGYSQIMCNNCYKQLYESYKFVLLAKSTQKELRKNPPINEIKKEISKIPPIVNENSPLTSNLSSNFETQKENTLSPIKENIDSNLNSNTKIDIVKIKNIISDKIPQSNQNKRLALRSSIKKEEIVIIENNNSIDLTSSPVEENLPSNLIENEKKPEFIEPKPLDPLPVEKKPRRTERKFSKTKEIETPEIVTPIEIDLKEEQKSPIDKKIDIIEIVEIKENSDTSKSEAILNPFSISETKTETDTLPLRKKRRRLAFRFTRRAKKGSKARDRVVKSPIVKIKRRRRNADQKLIFAAQKSLSSVKSENDIEIVATASTSEVLLEKTTEKLVASDKKAGESPSQKTNVKLGLSDTKPLLKTNKRTAAFLEFKRRFSDRVASKLKENEIKIDLTLSEEPEVVPIEVDAIPEMISKELKNETITNDLKDEVVEVKIPEKSYKEEVKEKSLEKTGNFLEIIGGEKSPENKEKLAETSPKEKEMLPDKILKRARSPDKSVKDKPSERLLRVRSLENPSKGNPSGKTLRDKSPEKSPNEKPSEKLLRDRSSKQPPKGNLSESTLRDKSPEKSPKEMSSGKILRERSPEKSPKEPSKEKIPRRKNSKLNPILIDDDTIIKKVENDPAVLKFLKQSSKNEKVLKEHTFENLHQNQTQNQTQTTSKKLSPTKILIVRNKRRSKKDKDTQERSKLVQTSIASYYMSPPDKQIKQEMLSPKIESSATFESPKSSISITRSKLEGESPLEKINVKSAFGESPLQITNVKLASSNNSGESHKIQNTNVKLSPSDKKSGESPLQKTTEKLASSGKKSGESLPLQKTNVKLSPNDKKSLGEPPKLQKIDSKLSSNEITLFTQTQSQSKTQPQKNRRSQKHISIMSPKMLKSRKSTANSVPNQNYPIRTKLNQNGIAASSEPTQNLVPAKSELTQNYPIRTKLNQNGVPAISEPNLNGVPDSLEPTQTQTQNFTFLGEISLLPQSPLNDNPVKMGANLSEPYVLLETLDSNILKRKRLDSISPLQLKKPKQLQLQQSRSLNSSKKLISKLKSKKITVVSHKKNSDGKLRKKVKKTFIKINTKYLTRTIKDKDKNKRKVKQGGESPLQKTNVKLSPNDKKQGESPLTKTNVKLAPHVNSGQSPLHKTNVKLSPNDKNQGESPLQRTNVKLSSNDKKQGESPLTKTNTNVKLASLGESPLQKTNMKLSPNDKKQGESPLQRTNVKLSPNDKKQGESPLKTNMKLNQSPNDKKPGESPKEAISPSLDDILNAVGLVRKGSESVPSKHECKICKLKFCWTESYRRHLASKHKLMPYQCRICNDKFASAIKLRKHKKEVHDAKNKPYKCVQCGENFDTFETHLAHVQETHNNKPKINCKLCKAEGFASEEKLNEHLDWHEKVKRETEIIEQKVKASLPVIVRANNRNFQCEHCSKQFRKSSDLVRHNRVHTGEKPFPCSLCNQKFQQRPNLQKHIISVHSERKSFSCDICFKTFGRYDSKLRHMLTHSIEKPFTCNECKMGFVRECQLATHFKRIHSKNKKIKLEEAVGVEKAVAEI